MKIILCCLLSLLYASFSAGANLSIRVDPPSPVEGESFQMIFTISGAAGEDPFISFSKGNLEVLSKDSMGTQISTTIINGRIATRRTQSVSYTLVAHKRGNYTIRDIMAEVGSEKIKHKNISIGVKSERQTYKDFFVVALPSKDEIFIGEGIDIHYYLMFKVEIQGVEVAKFPKLNDWQKRFHASSTKTDRVNYRGQLYMRSDRYSARIFPTKTGKIIIDPIRLRVQYSSGRNRSFGFGFGRVKSKIISSKKIEVLVKSLPTQNIPRSFSGLVGKHEIKLDLPSNKFLVNEAIEVRLTVEGKGALESYEGPVLWENKVLETFDTKSSFEELGRDSARKVFEYTYLGRESAEVPGGDLEISFFDPEKEKYITKNLKIPSLKISGTARSGATSSPRKASLENLEKIKKKWRSVDLLSPSFTPHFFLGVNDGYFSLNIVLLFLIFLLLFSFLLKNRRWDRGGRELKILEREIKKNGPSYKKIHGFLEPIRLKSLKTEVSLKEQLDGSSLSSEAKRYFKNLVIEGESMTFNNKKALDGFKYNKKYFKEVMKLAKDENINKH